MRYAKRSRMEVQGELYVALDEEYILASEFKVVSKQARRIPRGGTAVRGFINYSFYLEALDRLKKPARHPAGWYQVRKVANPEP